MGSIAVLVVDDSAVMRKKWSSLIGTCSQLHVVAKARNGLDCLEKTVHYRPDVILLDVDMPVMDGLESLKQIMFTIPTPVIVISQNPDDILQAFEFGAVDFMLKKELEKSDDVDHYDVIIQRIRAASLAKMPERLPFDAKPEDSTEDSFDEESIVTSTRKLIVIGTSTGGPAALQKILPQFPADFPVPILVIQHMPVGFTKSLADRLNQTCQMTVREAQHEDALMAGTILIAPAGWQTMLKREHGQLLVTLTETSTVESLYKPSIDVTLLSAAPVIKEQLVTVIMTGMGDDGLKGCKKVKMDGGIVLAEAESSCIIYGMPKVVYEAGLVDVQAPLKNLFHEIMNVL